MNALRPTPDSPDKGFITYYYNVFRSDRPETLLSIYTGYQKKPVPLRSNTVKFECFENAINEKTFSDFILVYTTFIRTTASSNTYIVYYI